MIQIVITKGLPLQAILRSYYTTILVNIITWNKAYSAYPLPTFIKHKGYLLHTVNGHLARQLDKYTTRGWRFQGVAWPEEKEQVNCPMRSVRRLGDIFTWRIPFDTTHVHWSSKPDQVIEYSNFSCHINRGEPDTEDGPSYRVSATLFKALTLKYRYIYGDRYWMQQLGSRMETLSRFELRKLEPAKRPPYDRWTCLRDLKFKKPDTWTYWDSEIPEWYHLWEQSRLEMPGDDDHGP